MYTKRQSTHLQDIQILSMSDELALFRQEIEKQAGEPIENIEINAALYDLIAAWGVGTPARGPKYWPERIEKRKALFEKLKQWAPPPALGEPPEIVTEPFTIMLWGITTDSIQAWLHPKDSADGTNDLSGFPGSPGVAEGPARVITSVEQLSEVQDGEILVCPTTTPSWALT